MYQGRTTKKTEPEKPSKWRVFLNGILAGKFLLKTWRKWAPWLLLIIVVMTISVYNERSIDAKEARIREDLSAQDSLMRELRKINEVIYADQQGVLAEQAAADGFEPVNEYEYYKIVKEE